MDRSGFAMTRVDNIVKKRSPLDDYDERAAALKANDANGWRDLGSWASHQGLSMQSRQAYQKVLDVVPDDPEARGALGFVKYNGRWMTEDESYQVARLRQGRRRVDDTGTRRRVAASDRRLGGRPVTTRNSGPNRRRVDKLLAEARADEAEQRARDAEQKQDFWNKQPPVYWGGWGVGATGWPSTANARWRSGYRPATFCAGPRRCEMKQSFGLFVRNGLLLLGMALFAANPAAAASPTTADTPSLTVEEIIARNVEARGGLEETPLDQDDESVGTDLRRESSAGRW